MKERNVIILRGASGCGKSTFCELIAEPKVICSADHFFYDSDGNYNWDGSKLGQAHEQCKQKFLKALQDDSIDNIIIDNTNTKVSEYNWYHEEALKMGLRVTFVVIEKRHEGGNIKNTPREVLERHEKNIKSDLKLI